MDDDGDKQVSDVLEEAVGLYENYLELAQLAEIPQAADDGYCEYPGDQPLGLVIRTDG